MKGARLTLVAVAIGTMMMSSLAFAQDESLDAAAEVRFKEGVAFAKQGKYDQARGSFLQTLALSPNSPKVLLNLAISEHGAGKSVDALGHLKTYLASPKVDPKKAQEIRQSLYDELWRATGHLRIVADRGDAIVLDADTKLGNAPLADVIDVTAGKHKLTAGSGGNRTAEITVAAGETKDVSLVSEVAAPAAPHPATATETGDPKGAHVVTPPAEEPKGTIWKPLTFVFGGATILAGVGALYFNAKSGDADDSARAIRAQHAGESCGGAQAPAFCTDLTKAIDDQDSNAGLAKGFWIGAGVLLAATIGSGVLWATSSSRTSSSAAGTSRGVLVPVTAPGYAGALYKLSF